jgi:hypothetical protein
MLTHNGAVVASAPRTPAELTSFIQTWVAPSWSGGEAVIREQAYWLASVAKITRLQAACSLGRLQPRIYDNLMFRLLGNGYGDMCQTHEVDLLAALQRADTEET